VALGLLDAVLVRLVRLVVRRVVLRLGHLESLASFDQHKQTDGESAGGEGRIGGQEEHHHHHVRKDRARGGGELPKRALAEERRATSGPAAARVSASGQGWEVM